MFSLKGLSVFQIKQVISLVYHGNGQFDASDRKFILREREQVIKKFCILEMMNFKETIDDIGGLKMKAEFFFLLGKDVKFGVDLSSGISSRYALLC